MLKDITKNILHEHFLWNTIYLKISYQELFQIKILTLPTVTRSILITH